MEKLITIQKRNNLNGVFVEDEAHEINKGHHKYRISYSPNENGYYRNHIIEFQNGPRHEKDSTHGVLDSDLLEIVLHRMRSFQNGPYATRDNAIAITHIEDALLRMNKRAEDRFEANKLGTNKI